MIQKENAPRVLANSERGVISPPTKEREINTTFLICVKQGYHTLQVLASQILFAGLMRIDALKRVISGIALDAIPFSFLEKFFHHAHNGDAIRRSGLRGHDYAH